MAEHLLEMSILQRRLAEVEAEMTRLQMKVATLQAEHATLQTEHTTLQAQYAILQAEHAALRAENAKLRAENATLRCRLGWIVTTATNHFERWVSEETSSTGHAQRGKTCAWWTDRSQEEQSSWAAEMRTFLLEFHAQPRPLTAGAAEAARDFPCGTGRTAA